MKKILVTGASGYIGSNLFKYLKRVNNFEIYGIDRQTGGIDDIEKLDLRNESHVKDYFQNNLFDIIFHFAGSINSSNYKNLFFNNVFAANNILESIKNKNTTVYLVGTADQYGNYLNRPQKEDDLLKPVSSYGLTKQMQEEVGKYYINRYKMNIIFLIIYNIYGESQQNNFIIPKFFNKINEAIKNKTNVNDYKSNSVRDFIYIEDFFKILLKTITIKQPGLVLNIGTGNPIKINDILYFLCNHPRINKFIEYDGVIQDKIRYQVANVKTVKKIIGEFKFTDVFAKTADMLLSDIS